MDPAHNAHDHGRGLRQPHDHNGGHQHRHENNHDYGRVGARIKHALLPHSHDHTEAIQNADQATSVGIRAAWISLAGMGATALLQIVIVWLSGSVALLADTLHNLGHLATTIPLIIAFRLGRRAPTRRYNYGFRRAEDLVGLLIGAVIALSAGLIVWESIQALTTQQDMTHLGWVLAAALVGAAGNEIVAIYRIRAGRRIGSAALIAEGQHARTDALTSLAVVIGVIGAWVGLPWVDPVIGLVIAVVIIAVLINSMRTVVHRLMDGIDAGTLDVVEASAAEVSGVVSVDRSRARWIGHRLEADLEIAVAPALTVAASHGIARAVHDHLRRNVPHLDRATVHVNPAGTAHTPDRDTGSALSQPIVISPSVVGVHGVLDVPLSSSSWKRSTLSGRWESPPVARAGAPLGNDGHEAHQDHYRDQLDEGLCHHGWRRGSRARRGVRRSRRAEVRVPNWQQQSFIGDAYPAFKAGQLTRIGPRLQATHGRVLLAGADRSARSGTMEGRVRDAAWAIKHC